jgi:CBS domain-containing protein
MDSALHTGTVGEVMTPGVLTCLPVTPLRDVARMMVRHRVLVTSEKGLPVGVISSLDVARALAAEDFPGDS